MRILFVLILLAAVIVFVVSRRQKRSSRRSSVPSSLQGVPQEDWDHLLKICLGNKKQARRLIRAEQKRNPRLSPRKACKAAIQRATRQ